MRFRAWLLVLLLGLLPSTSFACFGEENHFVYVALSPATPPE
jgi:hypothetical protein